MDRKFWFSLVLIMLILMSFSTLRFNVGFEIRLNQIFILSVFLLIFLNDLKNKTLDLRILSFMFVSGLILALISLNSTYYKIGEIKFLIKYVFLFPAVFYIGSRLIDLLGPKKLINAIEIAVFIYCVDAIFLYFFPIPFLIHDRGALTGFQGTFWETVWLAKALMLLLIASISLRIDFKIFPRKKYILPLFYIFLTANLIFTKSKAIWVGFFAVLINFVIFKMYYFIKQYKEIIAFVSEIPKHFKLLKAKHIIVTVILITGTIFIFNNFVFEKPIVSKEMIMEKLEIERGKAFVAAVDLLKESNWLGGYGFGFVEAYFSKFYRDTILGLGEGVNMIFNSFLDMWITGGILGLIYLLALFLVSFSPKYMFTIGIPTFLFVVGNISPYTGSEYFWLFLGISYGIKKYSNKEA